MSVEPSSPKNQAQEELVFLRDLDAPREAVFRAWTEAARLAQWWGPEGFTNPVCKIDARAGGAIQIDMKGPDGTVYPMTGTFREVTSEQISFVNTPLDAAGQPLFEVLTTVTLSGRDGKTRQTVRAQAGNLTEAAAPYLEGMEEGWGMTLDRLTEYLKNTDNQ